MIDVHSHFVLPIYLDELTRIGRSMEDGFPIPVWSLENHLAFMEKAGIRWSLLSLSSPNYYNGDTARCVAITRQINEQMADYKRKYPDRIGFSACLPLPDIDASIAEAKYALDELGATSIRLASNTAGIYLGDPALEPLMKALDEKKAIVNIHPVKPAVLPHNVFTSGPIPMFEFICDTTRAVLNLVANGVLERYKNVRIIVPHSGSFLPNIYQRIYGISEVLVPKGLMEKVNVKENVRRMYFDITGDPVPDVLDFLMTIADPDKVMYGSDYPFNSEEMACHKIENLHLYLDKNPKFKTWSKKLLYKNAEELFRV